MEDRLYLVSAHDIADLRNCLSRGLVPPDLEAKLTRLARGELAHRSIAQNCRTIIALLQAANLEGFKGVTGEDCEQLLRVLAYVRKDDDAIPDYRADGFADDHQRSVTQNQGLALTNQEMSWNETSFVFLDNDASWQF
jgi:hypothetical protein